MYLITDTTKWYIEEKLDRILFISLDIFTRFKKIESDQRFYLLLVDFSGSRNLFPLTVSIWKLFGGWSEFLQIVYREMLTIWASVWHTRKYVSSLIKLFMLIYVFCLAACVSECCSVVTMLLIDFWSTKGCVSGSW